MNNRLNTVINIFIRQEKLPKKYLSTVEEYIIPLATWISAHKQEKTVVVGINGAQGCGKSTMTQVLSIILKEQGYHVAILSIDDLYLTQQERLKLAQTIHPLLKTRGVPGTHDVALGLDIIKQLLTGSGDVFVPKFDKSVDERASKELWARYKAPVDFVLFEGWCLATPPQSLAELEMPVNKLEATEDRERIWRGFINQMLAHQYQQLFNKLDVLLFLKAPRFDAVLRWRGKQEKKTFRATEKQGMDAKQLIRFIQHYERLTRVNLEQMPKLADIVFELDDGQNIIKSTYKPEI